MKRKLNDCGKCPYYCYSTDYWGEINEWCEIGNSDKKMNSCYHSMFIRKILNAAWKLKEKYYNWRVDRDFKKVEKQRYNERVKLGLTEEEYEQFEYDELERN